MKRTRVIMLLQSLLALAVAGIACKESLPDYQDPRGIFTARLRNEYAISAYENALRTYLTVYNRFDETFEGKAVLTGEVVLKWAEDQTLRKTFSLSPANLLYASSYDPITGMLRIDPGDSIRLGVVWDFTGDDGRSLLQFVTYKPDPTCLNRCISTELVPVIAEGHVLLYQRTEAPRAPSVTYRFEMHREFVPSHLCVH